MFEIVITVAGVYFLTVTVIKLTCTLLRLMFIHVFSKIMKTNIKKKFGEWAVVTGGTDGIGKCYARELARRGMNIVIVSRNIDKLSKVATEIETDFKVQTKIIRADFSQQSEAVYLNIQTELQGCELGVLVNNVGVISPYPQLVTEMSDEQIWQHVNVNVTSLTMMTRLVLPGMQQRRRGVIVNLSSLAAVAPVPYLSVYAATKSYVESLSDALRLECRGTGVQVQTLCPGYVNTQMLGYSEELQNSQLSVPSAQKFAEHAVSTLGMAGKTSGYWMHDLQGCCLSLLPTWLISNFSLILNRRFRRKFDNSQARRN